MTDKRIKSVVSIASLQRENNKLKKEVEKLSTTLHNIQIILKDKLTQAKSAFKSYKK